MNTNLVEEKLLSPAKGIPVLILDLVMLLTSIVLSGVSRCDCWIRTAQCWGPYCSFWP